MNYELFIKLNSKLASAIGQHAIHQQVRQLCSWTSLLAHVQTVKAFPTAATSGSPRAHNTDVITFTTVSVGAAQLRSEWSFKHSDLCYFMKL
jgi:hypothetical protein